MTKMTHPGNHNHASAKGGANPNSVAWLQLGESNQHVQPLAHFASGILVARWCRGWNELCCWQVKG
jgi:hypothetical protein